MKLIHLADLHIGKIVNGFSMLEDQRHILKEIVRIISEEDPDAVLIAGDVYDRPVPSAEAVGLFDDFLVRLAGLKEGLQIFVISGNHDSAERIAFGGRLMEAGGLHMSPVYNGQIRPFTLRGGSAEADVWMLPFVRPAQVRRLFPDEVIETWTDALRVCISRMDIDPSRYNVILAHQFVTGASRSDSEEIAVGGLDNVDAAVFDQFDYAALGHIHRPQFVSSGNDRDGYAEEGGPGKASSGKACRIRYAGSPLKYSFSECAYEKSVTVIELGSGSSGVCHAGPPDGPEDAGGRAGGSAMNIRTVPLVPLRGMKEIRGTFDELSAKEFYEGTSYPDDYLHVTLTDENDVPDAQAKLRVIYPFMMELDYDNTRTRTQYSPGMDAAKLRLSPGELFSDFYAQINGQPMSDEQREFADQKIRRIWEGEG